MVLPALPVMSCKAWQKDVCSSFGSRSDHRRHRSQPPVAPLSATSARTLSHKSRPGGYSAVAHRLGAPTSSLAWCCSLVEHLVESNATKVLMSNGSPRHPSMARRARPVCLLVCFHLPHTFHGANTAAGRLLNLDFGLSQLHFLSVVQPSVPCHPDHRLPPFPQGASAPCWLQPNALHLCTLYSTHLQILLIRRKARSSRTRCLVPPAW